MTESLILRPEEIRNALDHGEVTLARPVEAPKTDWYLYEQFNQDQSEWRYEGLTQDKFGVVFWNRSHGKKIVIESPFGKVGDELAIQGMPISEKKIVSLLLIHTGTEVKKEDGKWIWLGKMEVMKNES